MSLLRWHFLPMSRIACVARTQLFELRRLCICPCGALDAAYCTFATGCYTCPIKFENNITYFGAPNIPLRLTIYKKCLFILSKAADEWFSILP